MPRSRHRLTALGVKAIKTVGRHSDGGGLYFCVTKAGHRKWTFRFRDRRTRKVRDHGLGAYPMVSLEAARGKADQSRQLLVEGKDPIRHNGRTVAGTALIPTFKVMADEVIASLGAEWVNPKHKKQWPSSIAIHAKSLHNIPVDEVTTEDVLNVLRPIWTSKTETATRLRGRIERILDAAKVKGHRSGENPARWRGHLQHILPTPQKLKRGHFDAMPYDEVPKFMARLRAQESIGARALEFVILTASRSGQVVKSKRDGKVRGARFEEVEKKDEIWTWTVPAERMKGKKGHKREHRVPLSPRALAIVEQMRAVRRGPFIFPGVKNVEPISDGTLEAVMRRLDAKPCTVHGFRSSFRDFAREVAEVPGDIAEAAIAHIVADKTERAYLRGDALDARARLMHAWAQFCEEPRKGKSRL